MRCYRSTLTIKIFHSFHLIRQKSKIFATFSLRRRLGGEHQSNPPTNRNLTKSFPQLSTGFHRLSTGLSTGNRSFRKVGKKREDFSAGSFYNVHATKTQSKGKEFNTMRKQFTFYRSFWECAEKMKTNREKLEFFEMLCKYALDETEPDLSTKKPAPATLFCAIKPTLERAHRQSKNILTGRNLY